MAAHSAARPLTWPRRSTSILALARWIAARILRRSTCGSSRCSVGTCRARWRCRQRTARLSLPRRPTGAASRGPSSVEAVPTTAIAARRSPSAQRRPHVRHARPPRCWRAHRRRICQRARAALRGGSHLPWRTCPPATATAPTRRRMVAHACTPEKLQATRLLSRPLTVLRSLRSVPSVPCMFPASGAWSSPRSQEWTALCTSLPLRPCRLRVRRSFVPRQCETAPATEATPATRPTRCVARVDLPKAIAIAARQTRGLEGKKKGHGRCAGGRCDCTAHTVMSAASTLAGTDASLHIEHAPHAAARGARTRVAIRGGVWAGSDGARAAPLQLG